MTTAVRPASGKKWADEIPEFLTTDEDTKEERVTRYGDEILEYYAMSARFGYDPKAVGIPLPEGLSEGEIVTLVALWNIKDKFLSKCDPRKTDEQTEDMLAEHGRYLWWLLRLWVSDPQTGHFIGRGFKGNEEDADKWLGN